MAQPAERRWDPEPAEGPLDQPRYAIAARKILESCRGEGPANCVARCPLHVDGRAYVQLAKEGRFREALQKVREELPFPGVLGYVCDHPCELHCKKVDEDDPVRIRDIKRFLAEWEPGEPEHLLDPAPDRGKSVAVVGAGPGGLLAAHDLRRQGYSVTVFEREERIGGCLTNRIPEWRLPQRVVERDLSVIEALGIKVMTGVEVGRDVTIDELREDNDAVLLLVGYAGARRLAGMGVDVGRGVSGTLVVDPVTCETGIAGVFAGGDAVSGPATVITALSLGRRAAESVDRFLTGEDLRSGRDAPMPQKLLWGLEISEEDRRRRTRQPVMLEPANEPMTEEEVLAEGERCLDCECGLCVEDCEFLSASCDSPKDLARMVLDDFESPETLKMLYSCNICALCDTVCPEDLDTGAMLLDARREAVGRGLGPLPCHKPIVSYFNAGVSKAFTLIKSEPGRQRSKRLFFTGCALPCVAPKNTRTVYEELRRHYPGTGVMMYCCGAPVELLGMDEEFEKASEDILRQAEAVGAEELITACPDCTHTLTDSVPELKVRTAWELLAGVWQPPRLREGAEVAVHDSCKARGQLDVWSSVRTLLEDGGATVAEIEYNGEKARCCGFGGMIYPVDPELSKRVTRRRGEESELPMVTYCAGCRMALAGSGKEAIHILDMLLDLDWESKSREKAPGGLPRYLNRLRTKWAFKRMKPLEKR
ncbi:MAG: heterodisulfide reductase-related iron-sulfur binding cluster [Acidobacteriota bacterium]